MRRGLLFSCICLLLNGCVTLSKEEQDKNMIEEPSTSQSIAQALATGKFQSGDWPKSDWWTQYQEEGLNTIILDALEHSPTLSAVNERIAVAKQEAVVTRSKLFPFIFFDATQTWEHLSKNGVYYALNNNIDLNDLLTDLSLGFSWELDFWGKNKNLYLSAIGRTMTAKAEAAQVEIILTTALSQLYFALKANLTRKGLLEELVKVRAEKAMLEKLLLDHALLSKIPTQLADERVEEAAQLLFAINSEVETNKHGINALRGKGPDLLVPLDLTPLMPPNADTIPAHLSSELLTRRPDLMAAKWRIDSILHAVNAAIADFFPRINLAAMAGYDSIVFRKLFNADSGTAALTPSLHLPIFTAGAIRANVNREKAAYQEAVFDFNNLLLHAAKEVTDALVVLNSVIDQKKSQSLVVESAAVRLSLVTLNYKSGLESRLAVLKLEEEMIEQQLREVSLLYTQYASQINLIKSLGGGYHCE